MSIYYHDTPKPLAEYRDRVQRNVIDAKLDLYGDFQRRWGHWRFIGPDWRERYLRHFHKVVQIANREAGNERNHRAA